MRNNQLLTLLILGTILTIAVVLTLVSFGVVSGPAVATVSPVEDGCQEIAVLVPATSVDVWERLVGAMDQIKVHWPDNHPDLPPVDYDTSGAWPEQSAAVPQFAITVGGPARGRLLVRWYKVAGSKSIDDWITALSQRRPPPLAIIGGETTRRAQDISRVLENRRGQWRGRDPLFLITTATADSLIGLYPGRNFRFSFPNSAMMRAVMDFVEEYPELLWPEHQFDPAVATAMFGAGNGLSDLTLLQLEQKFLNYAMFGVSWDDDLYSQDLCDRFLMEFRKRYYPASLAGLFQDNAPKAPAPANDGELQVAPNANAGPDLDVDPKWLDFNRIAYSTGDYLNPNYLEAAAALQFSQGRSKSRSVRQLLVLPASTDRARRFLKAVINSDPLAASNLAVVSGDSITFNSIYRDHNVAWNILDLPVPLVFFSHRNPVFADSRRKDASGLAKGFHPHGTPDRPWATTGMQDLLLHRDVLEAVVTAAYHDGPLVTEADTLDQQLAQLYWVPDRDEGGKIVDGHVSFRKSTNPFFDKDRNRHQGTGEQIVLLEPQHLPDGVLLPKAMLTVWSRQTTPGMHRMWSKASAPLDIYYTGAHHESQQVKKVVK